MSRAWGVLLWVVAACGEAGTVVVVRQDTGLSGSTPVEIELYVVEPDPARPQTYVRVGDPAESDRISTDAAALAAGVEVVLVGEAEVRVAAVAWAGEGDEVPVEADAIGFHPPALVKVSPDVARRYSFDLDARRLRAPKGLCAPDEGAVARWAGAADQGSCLAWTADGATTFIGWPGDRDCDGVEPEDPTCASAFDGAQCDPAGADDFAAADADGDGYSELPDGGLRAVTCDRCGGPGALSRDCDCDPEDDTVHADALELCDGTDQNCRLGEGDVEETIELFAAADEPCTAVWGECSGNAHLGAPPTTVGCRRASAVGAGAVVCDYDGSCSEQGDLSFATHCLLSVDGSGGGLDLCPTRFALAEVLASLVEGGQGPAPDRTCIATLYGVQENGPLGLAIEGSTGPTQAGLRVVGRCGDLRVRVRGGAAEQNVLEPVVLVVEVAGQQWVVPVRLSLGNDQTCSALEDRACQPVSPP